jgi:hypothetical protein
LQQVNVSRQAYLTAKCKKIRSYQVRLENATRASKDEHFQQTMDKVNPMTYKFILQQVKNQKLVPRARRFTLEEKIFALTLYKASGKGYKLLSKIFALPSVRTPTNLLNNLPFTPGINKQLFNSLGETVKRLSNKDKHSILLFDEIYIDSNLYYNQKNDLIEGLPDNGVNRKIGLVDYATVFMIKRLHTQWKQAIYFSCSSGPLKSNELKSQITTVIKQCQEISLEVVATVCDQGSTNQTAINSLLKDTCDMFARMNLENKLFGFLINKKEVVPLYDVPHLFKGVRNNLLSKNLHFELNGQKKIAMWKHIEKFYYLDSADDTRLCPKLTDRHVIKEKINKMKVSYATQVFSHQVGALMLRISQWGK